MAVRKAQLQCLQSQIFSWTSTYLKTCATETYVTNSAPSKMCEQYLNNQMTRHWRSAQIAPRLQYESIKKKSFSLAWRCNPPERKLMRRFSFTNDEMLNKELYKYLTIKEWAPENIKLKGNIVRPVWPVQLKRHSVVNKCAGALSCTDMVSSSSSRRNWRETALGTYSS